MAGAEVALLGAASRKLAERGMNAHAPRFATGLTDNSSDDGDDSILQTPFVLL